MCANSPPNLNPCLPRKYERLSWKLKTGLLNPVGRPRQLPRTCGPNPIRGDRIRAYRICVLPVTARDGVIFSIAEVVTDKHHAIEGVLAVEPVVDFPHSVVAGVGVRETAIVRRRVRRGVLDQAAVACVGWRRIAAKQFQA